MAASLSAVTKISQNAISSCVDSSPHRCKNSRRSGPRDSGDGTGTVISNKNNIYTTGSTPDLQDVEAELLRNFGRVFGVVLVEG